MSDTLTPQETPTPDPTDGAGARRYSRRRFSLGVAAAGGAAVVAVVGRVGFGNASTPATPTASPLASPNASPMASPMASPAASPAAGLQVTISNFTFMPADIQVPVGMAVTWTNQDDIPHTVTANDGTSFASSLLDTGDSFTQRFTKPGTYPYHCALHPFMTARVVVK